MHAPSTNHVFFFGSLRDVDIATIVFGRAVQSSEMQPAVLPDYVAVAVKDEVVPVLIANPGGAAEGVLMQPPTPQEAARIAFFESVDYSSSQLTVTTDAGDRVLADLWFDARYTAIHTRPWNLESWTREHKQDFMQMTAAYMSHFASGDVAAAEAAWDAALAEILGNPDPAAE